MIAIMSEWRSIFDCVPERGLAARETLFRRDEAVGAVYLVRTGRIALERPLADGVPLTLHTAGAGDLLAEASLFAEAYHCDAVACGAARVAAVPKTRFLAMHRDSPTVTIELLARAAREVQAQRARVEILRMRKVADRLDAWLDLHGEPPKGGWVDVAEAIGVTQPALYRELAKRRQ